MATQFPGEPIELPMNYTIGTDGEYQEGKFKLIVLRDGARIDKDGWHMDVENAAKDAWCHYWGTVAEERNEGRTDEWKIRAWRVISTDNVYSVDHLDHKVLASDLEEISIGSHGFFDNSSRNFISNLLCDHCGCAAVDDEVLSEYGLLNEDFVDEEEEEDESEIVESEEPTTWSLLVSNVGWVRKDSPDYEEVKGLYDEYAKSGLYAQVTLWSSESDDPIEETYTNEEEGEEEED